MKTPHEEAEIKAFDIVAKTLGVKSATDEPHLVDAIADAIREAEERGRDSVEAPHIFLQRIGQNLIARGGVFVRGRCEVVPTIAAPPGHVLDDKGVVRLLGPMGNDCEGKPVPLPLFADGALWCLNEEAWTILDGEVRYFLTEREPEWTSSGWVLCWGDGDVELAKCYSTEQAALAARSKTHETE